MKEFNNDCLLMCRIQGRIFEHSLEYLNCSSPLFIKKYMNGEDALSMDRLEFLNTTKSDIQVLLEMKDNDYGTIKYSADELFWIGYIYRYWAYTRNIDSKKLFKICPGTLLHSYYSRGAFLSEEKVIEEISESLNLNIKDETTLMQTTQNIIESKISNFKLSI